MGRFATISLLALALATAPAEARRFSPVAGGATGPGISSPRGTGGALLALPLLTLETVFGGVARLVESRAPLVNARTLGRDQGWQLIGFAVADRGLGAYLDVQGKVQFDRAQLVFDDGELLELDLGGATRGSGCYELEDFGRERGVLGMRLRARPASAHSQVGFRLAR